MTGLRGLLAGLLALTGGCVDLIGGPGGELDNAYTDLPEVTLVVMPENDVALMTQFKNRQKDVGADRLRIVGDKWGLWTNASPPGYDLIRPYKESNDPTLRQEALDLESGDETEQSLFEKELRTILADLNGGENVRINLVLSGHSDGGGFFGDLFGDVGDSTVHLYRDERAGGSSALRMSDLRDDYPTAFARVDRVYLQGCNTGRPATLESWHALFPNARMVAGFWQSSPLGYWAYGVFTGLKGESDRRPEILSNVEEMRIWLTLKDWQFVGVKVYPTHDPKSWAYLVSRPDEYAKQENTQEQYRDLYEAYFSASPGFEDPPSASGGALYEYYNATQFEANKECEAFAMGEAIFPSVRCLEMTEEMEISLRLRFFKNVRDRWLSQHYDEINWLPVSGGLGAGNEGKNLAQVLFESANRAELLARISAYGDEFVSIRTCSWRASPDHMHAIFIGDENQTDVEPVQLTIAPSASVPFDPNKPEWGWGRVINALCGLSHEEHADGAIEWEHGLDPGFFD